MVHPVGFPGTVAWSWNSTDFNEIGPKLIKKAREGASENFTTTLTRAAMGPIGADLIENTNATGETSQGVYFNILPHFNQSF